MNSKSCFLIQVYSVYALLPAQSKLPLFPTSLIKYYILYYVKALNIGYKYFELRPTSSYRTEVQGHLFEYDFTSVSGVYQN